MIIIWYKTYGTLASGKGNQLALAKLIVENS